MIEKVNLVVSLMVLGWMLVPDVNTENPSGWFCVTQNALFHQITIFFSLLAFTFPSNPANSHHTLNTANSCLWTHSLSQHWKSILRLTVEHSMLGIYKWILSPVAFLPVMWHSCVSPFAIDVQNERHQGHLRIVRKHNLEPQHDFVTFEWLWLLPFS